MTRIICDTMIWYNLSKNKLKIPDPERFKLVCTYLSLMELAFTPNNFNRLEEVQEVIKTILKLKPEFILDYPIDHARDLIEGKHISKHEIEDDFVLEFIKVLLNHPKEGLINNDFKTLLAKISSIRKENYVDYSNFLNELYEPIKEIRGIVKKYRSDKSSIESFRVRFLSQLNNLSENLYSNEQVDWSQFEFYEKIGARYFRNLQLTRLKADGNDDNDLKNMIYVQPNDRYWTLEKRWISIANEVRLEKYMYFPPTVAGSPNL